jgi:hypothetical protein
MGTYVYIVNVDKKEYICGPTVQSYADTCVRKSIDQCLFDLLMGRWKGDRVGTYTEHELDIFDWDKYADITEYNKRSLRLYKQRHVRILNEIKKEIKTLKEMIQQ